MNDHTLNEVMLDVRKAYRLLHSYNQRMFDIVRAIDESVENFTFVKTVPYENPKEVNDWNPKKGINIWSSLNTHTTAFIWSRVKGTVGLNPDDRVFAAEFCADGGFFQETEDDTNKWPDPREATTTLTFWLVRPTKNIEKMTVLDVYDKTDYGEEMEATLSKNGKLLHIASDINLADLADKVSLQQALKTFFDSAEQAIGSA